MVIAEITLFVNPLPDWAFFMTLLVPTVVTASVSAAINARRRRTKRGESWHDHAPRSLHPISTRPR